ncbi:sensor histidine kinase [Magnetococcus sp. PR-3]|uniref:sensor histidine kinase n=1 Tax=Magnetococcus sp. PR-3 TaxID=3120355 RepID=UPI002FCE346B
MQAQLSRMAFFGVLLLTLAVADVVTWQATWNGHLQQQIDAAHQDLELRAQNLQGFLSRYELLPELLAVDTVFKQQLRVNKLAPNILNAHLERLNSIIGGSDVYLMDRHGVTLAASNWRTERSFVGKDFSFRPYFKAAREGKLGRYFALGVVSRKRGYYFAHPIHSTPLGAGGDDDALGMFLGAVTVKVSLDDLEQSWYDAQANIMVTDRDGVVFLAAHPNWRYHTLGTLSLEKRQAIQKSRRFAGIPLQPLPIVHEEKRDAFSRLLTFKQGIEPNLNTSRAFSGQGKRFLLYSLPLPGTGWDMHTLVDLAPASRHAFANTMIVTYTVGLLFLLVYVMQQRRAAHMARMALERKTQLALKQAHDELEIRVERRTAALQQSNEQLSVEVRERKKAEEELKQAQSDLVQAGKLAAVGQMAAGITHEINQPLTAIRAYADNAQAFMQRGRPEKVQDNLVLIAELTETMGRIVNHLKVFSRKSPETLKATSPAIAAQEALGLLESAGKVWGIDITVNFPENADSYQVLADDIMLQQVFLNLLKNGRDVVKGQDGAKLWLSMWVSANHLHFAVRDNGPGIEAEALDQLFDPFFTTKPVGKGMGLGLSISYGIVRQFKGVLRGENAAQGGALFTLELPRLKKSQDEDHV